MKDASKHTCLLTTRSTPALIVMLATLVCGFFISNRVLALAFAPTEAEWRSWPEYCKARYAVSGAGVDSDFASRVTPAMIDKWQRILQEDGWYGFHHYCAGIARMFTAKFTANKADRNRLYTQSLGDAEYARHRTKPTNPIYAVISISMGQAYAALGNHDKAAQFFQEARETHPENPQSYAATAIWMRDRGKLQEARDMLLRGISTLKKPSAELNYILGLILVDLKSYDEALAHAKTAYKLGYPLPGLKRKLASAGHWSE